MLKCLITANNSWHSPAQKMKTDHKPNVPTFKRRIYWVKVSLTWAWGISETLLAAMFKVPPTNLLVVCRLMGTVCGGSALLGAEAVAVFWPLRCAVTIVTGALAGTTEMAMPPWLFGALMSGMGLALSTGQLRTASFCQAKKRHRVKKTERKGGEFK